MLWQNRDQIWHEPEYTLRHMTPQDIPGATALANSVGWGHQGTDWLRLLDWSPDGCFVIDETDRGIIGTVTSTSYGIDLAWIGMMIVAADRRRRGFGRQLMRAVLDHLIVQDTQRVMLDASEAGRPLYHSLGFREVYKVERWGGKASTYLGERARPLLPADVPAVLELDARLLAFKRPQILTRLIEEFPDLAWVDERHGQVEGFLLGHRAKDQVRLGPWMGWSAASAERLLKIALEYLQGQQVILDIPDYNGRGLTLARIHNLHHIQHNARMIYGSASPPEGEPLTELAIGMPATG
jgi:GNAT superfamily N-acetyltransferase